MKGKVIIRVVAVLLATAAVAVASSAIAQADDPAATAATTSGPRAGATYPPYPSYLIVKSEMRLKADLVQRNMTNSPQLVFFGGSRSQRFSPAYARKRTGLRAVNFALSCARPESAWGYLNWIYHRWPNAKVRWVWGVQSTMFKDRPLDPALLQDRRFYRYFPESLLKAQRSRLPDDAAHMPKYYGFLRNRYSPLGELLWNTYDRQRAGGYTLQQSLDHYIAKMLPMAVAPSPSPSPTPSADTTRARAYFEKTVRLLNEHGTTPIMVIMPIHPRVLRVMLVNGFRPGEGLLAYFAVLGETSQIKVLDFTRIQSFNGEREWFYDGVHITRPNANRIINAVKAKAGEHLK